MIWSRILFIFNILISQKIFDVKSSSDLEKSQKELASKKLEAEDHIEIMEKLKRGAEADKTGHSAKGFERHEDNEYSALSSLYQEFEKARLEKNSERMKSAMAALFVAMDNWFEEAKTATQERHKTALMNAYKMIINGYTEGLAKEGIHDMEIQKSDSEGTKFLKTVIKYDTAKTIFLKAKSEAERESAITMAFKYREAVKDHVRAMSHDEL